MVVDMTVDVSHVIIVVDMAVDETFLDESSCVWHYNLLVLLELDEWL